MRSLLRAALEERHDGKAERECEFTFFGRLDDFKGLKTASESEHQEQWEVPVPRTSANGGEGRIRVRKTSHVNGSAPEYVLTVKTKYEGSSDEMEVPVPTTEPMFDQFKLMAEKGMIKDRFIFPIEGTELVWEVDLFYLPGAEVGSGKYHDWCKIDLEVPSKNTPIPALPLEFHDLIMAQEGNRSVEEETQVQRLFDTVFITKNQHLAQ